MQPFFHTHLFSAIFVLFLSIHCNGTSGKILETVYGKITVSEPVLCELIDSQAIQRLKKVNQFGIAKYVHHSVPELSRYDHSIGVLALLKIKGQPLLEQISGLLHDVSHTAFSHVGDHVFKSNSAESSYHDEKQGTALEVLGASKILAKFGITSNEIDPDNPKILTIKRSAPDLSADRIDYVLQEGLLSRLISKSEFHNIVKSISFEDGNWILNDLENAKKLGQISIFFDEHHWSANWNKLAYKWTGNAIKRAFQQNIISENEFKFSTDDIIWNKLIRSEDPVIKSNLKNVFRCCKCYKQGNQKDYDMKIKNKFRGLDPLVKTESGLKRTTQLNKEFADEFARAKKAITTERFIKLNPSHTHVLKINTAYGQLSVTEPVLIDLIQCHALQRLKNIHVGGISPIILPFSPKQSRFDHSVGVFALLRKFGCPLNEQVAGLIHDISHTAFSHVGDLVFKDQDHQDNVHMEMLEKLGVTPILKKHGLALTDVDFSTGALPGLDQELPDICADRLDYTLISAREMGFISQNELKQVLSSMRYENGKWFLSNINAARKLARASNGLVEHLFGNPTNLLVYKYCAQALTRAAKIGLITYDELHTSTDLTIWKKLLNSNDPEINKLTHAVKNCDSLYAVGTHDKCDFLVTTKFRCIDPKVKTSDGIIRLTALDSSFLNEFERIKKKFAVKIPVMVSDTLQKLSSV